MKITVSYLSSKFDRKTTLEKIDACKNVDAIHADLMDGLYVQNKNFEPNEIPNILKGYEKEIDVHLMTLEPEKYLDILLQIKSNIIFFHPLTSKDPISFIDEIKRHNKKAGIVINSDEDIKMFSKYFPIVDAVLLMSVVPGKGGQHFLRDALVNYELIKVEKQEFMFELYVDGGINDESITFVKDADGVIAGSFICKEYDYEEQVDKLLKKIGQE